MTQMWFTCTTCIESSFFFGVHWRWYCDWMYWCGGGSKRMCALEGMVSSERWKPQLNFGLDCYSIWQCGCFSFTFQDCPQDYTRALMYTHTAYHNHLCVPVRTCMYAIHVHVHVHIAVHTFVPYHSHVPQMHALHTAILLWSWWMLICVESLA